jgi:hypothetical protein
MSRTRMECKTAGRRLKMFREDTGSSSPAVLWKDTPGQQGSLCTKWTGRSCSSPRHRASAGSRTMGSSGRLCSSSILQTIPGCTSRQRRLGERQLDLRKKIRVRRRCRRSDPPQSMCRMRTAGEGVPGLGKSVLWGTWRISVRLTQSTCPADMVKWPRTPGDMSTLPGTRDRLTRLESCMFHCRRP